ncbi:MAG TPA: M48 family metallopeptidase [Burkholderiaceae bacterium]|nr:M48 family metallopeptidase [Burkholderiaceae bacterium]
MKLENRAPAEGINSSPENPLIELGWLLAGSLGVLVALVIVTSVAAQWIAPRIPYRYEAKLAATLPPFASAPDNEAGRQVQAELQQLADRLSARLGMPEGMVVLIGYRDDRTVNAFATIGGQAVFFRGLLARLDNENALAMVMAHELAHLKYRHASAALGRGVAVGVILSVVSADLGRSAAAAVLSQASMATLLSFNRDQERDADEAALFALHAEYGHVGGAIDLFDVLARLPNEQSALNAPPVEFLRTHPLTANRIEAIKQWAAKNGATTDGPRRPLPPAIAALRNAAAS